ncbi:sensor histidine kinase, partial [candidate division KSB1 bacterium]
IANNKYINHASVWLVLYIVSMMAEPLTIENALQNLLVVFSFIVPVYFHFFIFNRFFLKKKYAQYTILVLLSAVVYAYIERTYLFDPVEGKEVSFISNTFYVIVIYFISTAVIMLKDAIKQKIALQEIRAKQIQTELALLKSQVEPHFLFNTLNNLYYLAQKNQDNSTADGLSKLAGIMRYMIYDSNVDTIPLKKEIEQIEQFIDLQKLRFEDDDDNFRIDFSASGDIDRIKIPPMLLIPFIENAFKHSISLQQPSFIEIALIMTDNSLQFTVHNSINRSRKDDENGDSGMGLTNVKRRLELLYPNSHNLNIIENDKEFKIDLRIDL